VALPEQAHERLRCYRNALNNWKYEGYVDFTDRVSEWLIKNLPSRDIPKIKQLLFKFVADGGVIDEREERRPEYDSFEFHYDLRLKIDDRWIYFETVHLCDKPDDPDDSRIMVVNAHDV
jgi:hypothetical protein